MSAVEPLPASRADGRYPTFEEVRALLEWAPPLGVISIYLSVEPADRSGAWRTELRNDLDRIANAADGLDHRGRLALRSTADAIAKRFADPDMWPLPRGEVGFVEVAEEHRAQRWWPSHIFPRSPRCAYFAERPVVAPLVGLAERCAPRGVALLSAERVRLLQWAPGELEELESWELALTSLDWRERKAQRSADPARTQGVSAAGREQFGERLAENRHRFLGECHRLARAIAADRAWSEIVAFGATRHVGAFREGISSRPEVVVGGEVDLISTPTGELKAIVGEAIERLDGERNRLTVKRVLDAARGGMRAAAGARETLKALEEGRVEHLLVDCSGEIDREDLVRLALTSGASVTTVWDGAADLLDSTEGVAASLRY
jgi:Bacterial archaeo-eukaryotic release factor family 5